VCKLDLLNERIDIRFEDGEEDSIPLGAEQIDAGK